ncbi:hypothetical protein GCM10009868_35300 [Terrabacter aerolatus]|uniref:Uncharacterized protein n=1 Tax=Terrabacter aerolatus TaxID=422442 RepID=A0A512CWB9_9MICO|nr:hypothetical protein [Terrabacter aerolatus]GEO28485.1 hypothetical protein TAE01_02950 [Terrabacter aerolatus]
MTREFEFDFEDRYRLPARLFGITPGTARVAVTDDELLVRFGPWRLRTPLSNVAGTQESGDYAFHRTAGPAHLSLVDRGVTFATSSRRGLCVSFVQPVRAIEPTGLLRHPGMTVTVTDPEALAQAIAPTV